MWISKLIDAARGVIYDHHMFIVYATGQNKHDNLFQAKAVSGQQLNTVKYKNFQDLLLNNIREECLFSSDKHANLLQVTIYHNKNVLYSYSPKILTEQLHCCDID
jgi:hypothetical protein